MMQNRQADITFPGLDGAQVAKARLQFGDNRLREAPPPAALWLFLEQFKSFIIYILLFAIVFALAIGEYVDSLIIIVIVIANALIGFFQEFGAARSLAALKDMTEVEAEVLRDGEWRRLKSHELVPGDLIALSAGDRVPADGRLLAANRLLVEEAVLTGESLAVAKEAHVEDEVSRSDDEKNMVFSSTSIVSGRGLARVTATGMATEIGRIAELLEETESEMTPLQRRLDVFGRRLGLVIIAICVIVMLLCCGREYLLQGTVSAAALAEFAFIAISLAVAAVPTALPAVVTIALSIGVKRLLKRRALVRRLAAVETLGSCDIICSDKTGTLTCNRMTVVKAWSPLGEIDLEQEHFAEHLDEREKLIFAAGGFCNDARLATAKGGADQGDPTEIALLRSAVRAGFTPAGARVDEIPFDGERKMMSVLMRSGEDGRYRLYTKGAPDRVLAVCSRLYLDGEIQPLNRQLRELIAARNELYAGRAMRVLALAVSPPAASADEINREEELVFVGLQALVDPPRPEVSAAVTRTLAAGIRVIMITGDYAATASAIGQEIGVTGAVMAGAELEQLDDEELDRRLQSGTNIFARVVPEHKFRIISRLQQLGHTVAMTGDGVNDAPALKKADIGIAVGSGTDVAKEAADFILTDDSFAHIVNAIEEGRGIYDNIQKSIMLLLSGNLGEVLIIFLAVLLGWNLPLTAVLLLWINMVTDGAPALAFSVDGYGRDLMLRPPKDRDEALLPKSRLQLIAFMGFTGTLLALGLFYLYGGTGANQDEITLARTVVFNFVVLYEMILVVIIRRDYRVAFFSNPWLWLAVAVSLVFQALLMYTPLHAFFRIMPLGLIDIGILLAAGGLFYLAYELWERLAIRRQLS